MKAWVAVASAADSVGTVDASTPFDSCVAVVDTADSTGAGVLFIAANVSVPPM